MRSDCTSSVANSQCPCATRYTHARTHALISTRNPDPSPTHLSRLPPRQTSRHPSHHPSRHIPPIPPISPIQHSPRQNTRAYMHAGIHPLTCPARAGPRRCHDAAVRAITRLSGPHWSCPEVDAAWWAGRLIPKDTPWQPHNYFDWAYFDFAGGHLNSSEYMISI